jgi:serine/threonine protein kinase
LQRLIGEGGMGAVFQAEDTHLHRKVALKVMKPEFTSDNEGRLRFLAEAQAMAALPHDYVVLVYQVGLEHGLPFIAMEYLEGETLESFLKRSGRLPLIQALRVAADVATGLTVAHHRGVIHRDIKPSNLWLDSVRRRVKLLDFGLAHHARASTGLTRPGEVLGTPDYMAPEQAHGADVDSRTDLYALGVVLYRMLSGRLPYERSTAMATMYALANEPVPSLKAALPELPHEVAAYVARLMAKDPAKRPASAHEVARWLTDHRQRLKTVSTSAPSMPDIPMETTTTAGSVPRPNDMDAAFAVEYRAAEWAARKKGLVELRVRSSNRSITIDRVADLPTEPFVVMHLNLASRAISDAELVLLAGLSSVEMIDLTNTPITDRSTRFLGGLRSLRMLILAYTKITDAGLAALANLPRLRSLYLMGTEVTHEGVQAIQAALPRCQVMES